MNTLQKAGIVVFLLGLILPALGIAIPSLATVTYDQPDMMTLVIPYGTSSSPVAITAGTSVYLQCDVASANDPSKITVTANVPLSQTGQLGMTWNGYHDSYGGAEFTANWVAPSTLQGTYTITFTSYDSVNAQTVTFVTYISSGSNPPTGYFQINGVTMGMSSSLSVSNPSLKFDGYITSRQDVVQNMRVVIYASNGTLLASITLNLNTGTHYGSQNYTLPEYGKYTINGYIITSGGNFQEMSIVGGFSGSPYLDYINLLTVLGAILIVIGTIKKK